MALSPVPFVVKTSGASGSAPKSAVPIALYGVAGGAPLNSPAFTGTPTAPTAAVATNTTQLATTAFVSAATRTKTQVTALANVSLADATDAATTQALANDIKAKLNAVIAALKA